jgi:hypothetical protein
LRFAFSHHSRCGESFSVSVAASSSSFKFLLDLSSEEDQSEKEREGLLPPLLAVDGTAPHPPPETPAQLGGVAARGLATRKRDELSSWCEPSRSRCRCNSIEEL